MIQNPEEKRVVFENTHRALITQKMWDIVQSNRQQRRQTKQDEAGLFSGLAFHADCGVGLYLSRAVSTQKERESYVCGTYKRKNGGCSAHYIRAVVLEKLVLENLRKVIAYAHNYEDNFVRQVTQNELSERMREQASAKRQLEQETRRIAEIDTIIKRLYEDNVTEKLSDERFAKMSADYEREQKAVVSNTAELRKMVNACEEQGMNIKRFLKIVHSYMEPNELTPDMLHAFVEKVVVHAPDNSSGHRTQRIDIHYNFVGEIALFDEGAFSGEVATRETA